MKVLLLGEYSGVHTALSVGLKSNGICVKTAHSGDRFKSFPADISLKNSFKNQILGNIERIIRELWFILTLEKYDVIQIINPTFFSRFHFINPYKILNTKSKKIFLLAVGDDYYYWKAFRNGTYSRSPHLGYLKDVNQDYSDWETSKLKDYNIYLVNNCKIIACCDIYYKAYLNITKNLTFIPFPFYTNLKARPYKSNNNKLRILVSIQKNRIFFKGTNIFLEALEFGISQNLLNDFEILYIENVKYEEYEKILIGCDIVLDQLNAYEPGMNALLSMYLGKIVIGGNDPKLIKYSKTPKSPIVNIEPNKFAVLEKLIQFNKDRNQLEKISIEGINYVKNNHNTFKIATEFIHFWEAL